MLIDFPFTSYLFHFIKIYKNKHIVIFCNFLMHQKRGIIRMKMQSFSTKIHKSPTADK